MFTHRTGAGPALLFVHGSAADAESWAIQRRALASRYTVITCDRAGTPRSPLPPGVTEYSVARHADDLAALVGDAPTVVIGSSFGAVCVLELTRRGLPAVRGAVLCEPPLPPSDDGSPTSAAFLDELHRIAAERGGEHAAEFFLRTVLGDAYGRLTAPMRQRCLALHEQIRLDADALHAYRVGYASLAEVRTPVLLLGGDRSMPFFAPTLAALAAALPNARRVTLAGGSHMMHADAFAAFNDEVDRFARACFSE